ncbi:Hypothetical Protein FCC1311_089732 [Hondaea fermentalgiana]|uniref:Uncharacterized protein n=1 Tax=Hondaea fermentalgiana TaxID=2315210 RepID=A0A2R5GSL5_9STRA|nr:Hypothetical Protein FCC1311_089732 [Hondaea fermentalgiana]|eukprot:GBG32748.1 Hypothetical Protein FCC1311_089732 [Hondaea fermentalgiana]
MMRQSKIRLDRALDKVNLAKVAETETGWETDSEGDDDNDNGDREVEEEGKKKEAVVFENKRKMSGTAAMLGKSAAKYVSAQALPDARSEDSRVAVERKRDEFFLCAYAWLRTCDVCENETPYEVLATRVEKPDGSVVCAVTGSSPLKAIVRRQGVALAQVCVDPRAEMKRWFLGRACPRCCCAQGEFQLARDLRAHSRGWLDSHCVLRSTLPQKFAHKLSHRPGRCDKVFKS